MSANFIQVPGQSTGLKVDTTEVAVGANTVERQNICIADPVNVNANSIANTVVGTLPAQTYLLAASTPVDGYKQTYSAALTALNVGTGATTDVAVLTGSASKTIRVTRVGISSTEATATAFKDVVLSVRSAATTAGTSTTATIVPYDSSDAAGTAIVRGYTAAPTAGTAVGTIAVAKMFQPITGATVINMNNLIFDFGNRPAQAVVLRGTSQCLALTYNGVTPANAGSADIWFEWTEE